MTTKLFFYGIAALAAVALGSFIMFMPSEVELPAAVQQDVLSTTPATSTLLDSASSSMINRTSLATLSPATTTKKAVSSERASPVPSVPAPTPPIIPEIPPASMVAADVIPGTNILYEEFWLSSLYYQEDLVVTTARWPSVPEPKPRSIEPRAVVALYCYGDNGVEWKGSGNIINPYGYILTNRHVAEGSRYCEVALPPKSLVLPARDEIADLGRIHSVQDISGWRPYKAKLFFLPPDEGMSAGEKDALDFAIMKIDSVNDNCEVFNSCAPLPASFPYNAISNFHLPTSTAPEAFPAVLDTVKFNIPIRPYEFLSYGYPASGSGVGGAHVLRSNLGYAIAYLPGDKKFAEYPMTMFTRTLYGLYGGASGSGIFYNGHIIGLVYARPNSLAIIQYVIPMPLISKTLRENGKAWILDPSRSSE